MAEESASQRRRRELRDVEAQIDELRATIGRLRSQVRPEGGAAEDAEEVATDLTSIQEQEAVLGALERRRDAMLERPTGEG